MPKTSPPPPAEPPDEDLVRAARAGDALAFQALYQRYARRLYAFFLGYTGDAGLAEELVNDTFVRVWRGLPHYREEGHFRAWLFRIARNIATDAHRRRKRRPAEVPLAEADRDPALAVPPADAGPRLADIEAVLHTLPPDYRLVLLLRFIEGLSAAEVARIMERSPEAVRVLQYRALRARRAKLQAPGRE
ncbi:MAG: sigma-70 family RNA polymerase sigma factor [Chloroflexi bacterium]|nr:sigma-70 family RNA polymerase sigma factor [Chloroflexota bacterium]